MKVITYRVILISAVIVFLLMAVEIEGRKRRKKSKMSMILRQKETNAIDFIRLTVMRVIYGIATRVGLGEPISEALNGAFVPPGVDDYDYGGGLFGLASREDDEDDDYDY